MKHSKPILLLIFSLTLIFSCDMETIIDLEVPPHKPVLVLNGILDTDTTAAVVISHSVSAFSTGNPSFIQDAEVLLFDDIEENPIDSLKIDMSNLVLVNYVNEYQQESLPMYYYRGITIPTSDKNYRIVVNHPDYSSISASTYIPSSIEINNISLDTITDEELIGVSFNFQDDPFKKDYYRIKMFTSCEKKGGKRSRGDAILLSNEPSFGSINFFELLFTGYTFVGREVVFTDDLFDGQNKNISLDIPVDKYLEPSEYDEKIDEENYFKCDTIILEFSTFSDDTYSYYNSLSDHDEKGELNIFGGEVVPVYSNVNNGLGVFISTNAQEVQIRPATK